MSYLKESRESSSGLNSILTGSQIYELQRVLGLVVVNRIYKGRNLVIFLLDESYQRKFVLKVYQQSPDGVRRERRSIELLSQVGFSYVPTILYTFEWGIVFEYLTWTSQNQIGI